MNCNEVKLGMKVITSSKLDTTDGMFIATKWLDCRAPGKIGTVNHYVPGHGGDVWFVKHEDDDSMAPYCFNEMEPYVAPVMDFNERLA